MSFEEAVAFVDVHHRHHEPPRGHKFSIGAAMDDEVVGVVMVGRPVARELQDGLTPEVNRLAALEKRPTGRTNRSGEPTYHNVPSFLYGAARRATFALGYRRLVTYILATETGVSLVSSGWKLVGEVRGRSWTTRSRPRFDRHPTIDKLRFEVES